MKYSGAAPALSTELAAERGASDGTERAHPQATSATDTTALHPEDMMMSDYPIFFGTGAAKLVAVLAEATVPVPFRSPQRERDGRLGLGRVRARIATSASSESSAKAER